MFIGLRNLFVPHVLRALPAATSRSDRTLIKKPNSELAADFSDWLVAQRYANGTRRLYGGITREFCDFLGRTPLRRATHEDVRHYIALVISRTLSLDRGKRVLEALRRFFDFLYLGGAVNSLPPRTVYLRRGMFRKLPKALTESQMRRLIEGAPNPRDKAVLELLYATGCRPTELVRMQVSDVDFRERTIRVASKGKERRVLFGGSAARALHAYLGGRRQVYLFERWQPQPQGYVYFNKRSKSWKAWWTAYSPEGTKVRAVETNLGRGMSRAQALARFESLKSSLPMRRPAKHDRLEPKRIGKIVAGAAVRARLGRVHPYMIRHSFAIHLLEHGADIRFVQELLGHEWIVSTQKYTRVLTRAIRRTYQECHPR